MQRSNRWPVRLVLLVLPIVGSAKEIPIEDFFKPPTFSSFQLSPSGKYLAAIAPVNNRRNIAVIDLETRTATPVTAQTKQDVSGFLWANDERILFFMDKDGNESFGIFAVNRDGSKPKILIEPPATQIQGGSFVVRTASVLNRLENEDEYVLVGAPRVAGRRVIQDVMRLNIYTGKMSIVERNPGNIAGWGVDDEGVVYSALAVDGTISRQLWRTDNDADWEILISYGVDEPSFSPVWVSEQRDRVYVTSYLTGSGEIRDKAGLYRYDLQNRQIGELIFEHAQVDVWRAMGSEVKDDIIGAVYVGERPEYVFLDEEWAALHSGVAQNFPAHITSFASASEDEQKLVFVVWDSQNVGTYYLLDRKENRLEELTAMAEWLLAVDLAPMEPVTITARDGLVLPGYLTLPAEGDAERLPMVIHPHGGPWARDAYGYNPTIQLMANRGYAVLQVNFRGSIGYGREMLRAGNRQWGLKMQDDITDAVHWAVAKGIADPERICIFGASYGGYATMAGLTFTPELYQCGVNYVGVTDIPLLFDTIPRSWELGRAEMETRVGDPKADKAMLEDRSPINHVDKIKAPLFMAYGRQDPRVVLRHATDLEKQLKKHDVEYELMIKKDEGHGYRKFENQVEFHTKLIDFLDRHLKRS